MCTVKTLIRLHLPLRAVAENNFAKYEFESNRKQVNFNFNRDVIGEIMFQELSFKPTSL